MQNHSDLIKVGVIGTAYGLKGLVRVTSYTEQPERICDMHTIDTNRRKISLSFVRVAGPNLLICAVLSPPIHDKDAALSFRNIALFVERNSFPQINEDEFYIEDIKGMTVINQCGEKIGLVENVYNFGASDILEIRFLDNSLMMYPFTKEFFPEISPTKIVLQQDM